MESGTSGRRWTLGKLEWDQAGELRAMAPCVPAGAGAVAGETSSFPCRVVAVSGCGGVVAQLSSEGDLFYTGAGEAMGESQATAWPRLLPSTITQRVTHVAVSPDGKHSLCVVEGGGCYQMGLDAFRQKQRGLHQVERLQGVNATFVTCGSDGKNLVVDEQGLAYTFGRNSDANELGWPLEHGAGEWLPRFLACSNRERPRHPARGERGLPGSR